MLKNSWTDSLGRFRSAAEGGTGVWKLVTLGLDSLCEERPCGSLEGVFPIVEESAGRPRARRDRQRDRSVFHAQNDGAMPSVLSDSGAVCMLLKRPRLSKKDNRTTGSDGRML